MATKTGTVVFFDLVGFSTHTDPKQVKMAQSFMNALRDGLTHLWRSPLSKEEHSPFRILPTGDGAAIVIWEKAPKHPKREYTALWLAGQMLAWARTQSPQVGIRCGVNSGELDMILDPYQEHNVCGAAVNVAARIMDAANPGQLLVSRENFVQRLSSDNQSSFPDFQYTVAPETYEILAKHHHLLTVQSITGKIYRDSEWIEFGLPEEPLDKWYLQIEPPILAVDDYGIKQLKKPPVELLKKHKKIAFVGATNDALAESLKEVLRQEPGHRWESIEVFFLTDERFDWMETPERNAASQREDKKKAIRDLRDIIPKHTRSWGFYEYDRPFFFASYWDWEQPGGRIHVSSQIWGANIKDRPAFDFVWRTREPTSQYKAYRDGLEKLRRIAQPIKEFS